MGTGIFFRADDRGKGLGKKKKKKEKKKISIKKRVGEKKSLGGGAKGDEKTCRRKN